MLWAIDAVPGIHRSGEDHVSPSTGGTHPVTIILVRLPARGVEEMADPSPRRRLAGPGARGPAEVVPASLSHSALRVAT